MVVNEQPATASSEQAEPPKAQATEPESPKASEEPKQAQEPKEEVTQAQEPATTEVETPTESPSEPTDNTETTQVIYLLFLNSISKERNCYIRTSNRKFYCSFYRLFTSGTNSN